jgi:DNA-binding SARP family transcriptional activator
MPALEIRLFGAVNVTHRGLSQRTRPIHAVKSLLAWLLLHRKRMHAREELAAVFWGEQSDASARNCLNTALWRLRQVLEPDGIPRGTYLVTDANAVGFNGESDYWLDIAAFEEGVGRGEEGAVTCYTGDLLAGFYDDWVLRERERLRLLYLDCLGKLLRRHSETGALEQALHCGERILMLDPLREDVHRELIQIHLRNGQRAFALQQYERCRAALEQELGVAPMEETRALCASLSPRLHGPVSSVARAGPRQPSQVALTREKPRIALALEAAAEKLDEARAALDEALRLAATTRS